MLRKFQGIDELRAGMIKCWGKNHKGKQDLIVLPTTTPPSPCPSPACCLWESQRSEKMQKQRKAIKQDKIVTVSEQSQEPLDPPPKLLKVF